MLRLSYHTKSESNFNLIFDEMEAVISRLCLGIYERVNFPKNLRRSN